MTYLKLPILNTKKIPFNILNFSTQRNLGLNYQEKTKKKEVNLGPNPSIPIIHTHTHTYSFLFLGIDFLAKLVILKSSP